MAKMKEALSDSVKVVGRTLRYAVAGRHPKRREIALTYLLLNLRVSLSNASGRPLHAARVLGRTVHFQDARVFTFLFWEVFFQGNYLSSDLTPKIIIDCGSNIGMSVLLFKSLWPDSQITAVEAAPATFELLKQNTKDLAGVRLINKAISDSSGTIKFYSGRSDLAGSINPSRGGQVATEVETIPMSDVVEGPTDLLKIDIEGSEMAAFRELEASGKMPMIRNLFIEYHHHLAGEPQQLSTFLARLERAGFTYELSTELPNTSGEFQDIFIRAKQN